jgi:probable phosphoglycerate mutase
MEESLQTITLVRHAETEWSATGQHTGLTDLALTRHGEACSLSIGPRLAGQKFAKVLTSPLQRAARTCDLAGFGQRAEIDADLVEWDYGQYEGLRAAEIDARHPGWNVFRDGCPGGESPDQVAERADRVVARARAVPGNVLLFSSGHFLRMLAIRWIGMPPAAGGLLFLGTASVSILGYDHNLSEPVIRLWNDTHHLQA